LNSLLSNSITAAGARALAQLCSDSLDVRLDTDLETVFVGERRLQTAIKELQAGDPSLTVLG
jgi:hypothetical protein